MRILISILTLLGVALIVNMGAYVMSEDYRFFIKKLKYSDNELVYDDAVIIDDTPRVEIIENITDTGELNVEIKEIDDDLLFLDIFSESSEEENDTGRELLRDEQFIIDSFEQKFILTEQEFNPDALLFELIDEYPDPYREYRNSHLSLYVFPSKSYSEIQDILELVSYESSFEINPVNNFGQSSLYINLREGIEDDFVRIVFEYENLAFGLKIKKDSYNIAKEILQQL